MTLNASLPTTYIAPTVSEEEQQGLKVHLQGDISALPRSVRWRIQLGLLQEPITKSSNCHCTLEEVTEYNRSVIAQQTEWFKSLVERHLEEDEQKQEEKEESTKEASAPSGSEVADIDPLTAMVMEQQAQETRKAELYLKYRKERARMKRGLAVEGRVIESESDEVDRASLGIIEKDLNRLPHPAEEKSLSGAVSPSNNTPENEARITSLREVLYIFSQEHPDIGYRQGMHEIASFLLFVLELEHQQYPDHVLFNPILPICYGLLESTLGQLTTAYDATGSGKSLQQMSIAILGKILQNDPTLYHHLTSNPNIPPPPIYCTRWVRLMFSREVVGYENVFQLWDVFFSYANIMQALEIASASRILLLGDALLKPDNNTLDLLMNVPPLTDITPLTDVLQKLMQQREGDQAVSLPHGLPPIVQQHFQPSSPIHRQPAMSPSVPIGGSMHFTPDQPGSMAGDNKFSFSKMRQSFGQKVDSFGQKIANKTMEWTEAARREAIGGSMSNPGSSSSQSFDPLGGLLTHSYSNNQHHQDGGMSHHGNSQPSLMSNLAATVDASTPNLTLQQPKTPKQHQHEMWSQLLNQKILTVQEFLMELESKENEGTVPPEVWEALADMDRMQRELLNYSRNMAGSL
ncbi:Rab-GTPase-TBC domain containing protein [Nitzschia inconspicua]|uniref:Rab-GTPase-TBC domain containing protein n=1 Tax=Nitzschia inconspicua TaxID=303405 RepID=A0A9K3Q0B4_9STRA|nr:Rab-GTPase-TBC domain containing protein [Nitzschia inconspicua]